MDYGIEVESQRRRVGRLGSWDWDLVGCFFALAFERLKDCVDDLVEESLTFGGWHRWVSWVGPVGSLVGCRRGTWREVDLGSWQVTLGGLEDLDSWLVTLDDLVEEHACLAVVGLVDRFAEGEA